jgi:dTDP-4-dehydrorhamnose reductase
MTILFTGGTGKLGQALQPYFPDALFPTRQEMDITWAEQVRDVMTGAKPRLIVHLAALVGTVICERNRERAFVVNVMGTRNLLATDVPMLYASSDYVFSGSRGSYRTADLPDPINMYGETKAAAERSVLNAGGKVFRFSFKPDPYPHAMACIDMHTSGHYLPVMAAKVAAAIRHYEDLSPVVHLGCERISQYDLARQTQPECQPVTRAELEQQYKVRLPADVSLMCSE